MSTLKEKKAQIIESLKGLVASKTKEVQSLKRKKNESIAWLWYSKEQKAQVNAQIVKAEAEIKRAKEQIEEIENAEDEEEVTSEE